MTVIAFARDPMRNGWSAAELATIAGALGDRDWETGLTEAGDAQFYVLGPRPDQACELCVSRIGGRYVLEDHAGRLLFEHRSLPLVAQRAARALGVRRWWLVARVVLLWATIRGVIHDRIEPLLAEGEDMVVHLMPQIAALA